VETRAAELRRRAVADADPVAERITDPEPVTDADTDAYAKSFAVRIADAEPEPVGKPVAVAVVPAVHAGVRRYHDAAGSGLGSG
jgi:hypothetical protein